MIRLVNDLRRQRRITILMTIHTPEDVVGIADHMVFVAEGRVIASGTPDAVLGGSADPRIAAFCGLI